MAYPNTKPSLEQFEQIANACGGILSDIAANFKVARNTVYAWCENDAEFRKALEDSRERFVDLAESNLRKLVAGVPQQMLHEVDFKALPSALVEKIELDIGDLKVGDTVRVADLDIAKDKDVDLTTDPETTVVTVTEVRGAAAETEDEDAAEAV